MFETPALSAWSSFYVMIGSSAAALTGLMFVVISLIRQREISTSQDGISIFSTPPCSISARRYWSRRSSSRPGIPRATPVSSSRWSAPAVLPMFCGLCCERNGCKDTTPISRTGRTTTFRRLSRTAPCLPAQQRSRSRLTRSRSLRSPAAYSCSYSSESAMHGTSSRFSQFTAYRRTDPRTDPQDETRQPKIRATPARKSASSPLVT